MKKILIFISFVVFASSCVVFVPRVQGPNKGYSFRNQKSGCKINRYPENKKFSKRKLYRKMY